MRIFLFPILLLLVFFSFRDTAYMNPPPPDTLIIQNRAPYEGEIGHGYNALKTLNLAESPYSPQTSCFLAKGEPSLEIETRVYAHPGKYPIRLLTNKTFRLTFKVPPNSTLINFKQYSKNYISTSVPEGETIYVVMYMGEGCYLSWYNDMIIELVWEDIGQIQGFPSSTPAEKPYWGLYLNSELPQIDYWIKLKKYTGETGWIIPKIGTVKYDPSVFHRIDGYSSHPDLTNDKNKTNQHKTP